MHELGRVCVRARAGSWHFRLGEASGAKTDRRRPLGRRLIYAQRTGQPVGPKLGPISSLRAPGGRGDTSLRRQRPAQTSSPAGRQTITWRAPVLAPN